MSDQKESAASLTIEYADTSIPAGVRVGELTIDGRGWPSGNHHFHVWQIPGGGLIAFPTVLSTPKRAKEAFAALAASALVEPAGWIPVSERLPDWVERDASPCVLGNQAIAPALYSPRVLVAIVEAGQPCTSTDKLVALEGESEPWWDNYGTRVTHWMPLPAAPSVGS